MEEKIQVDSISLSNQQHPEDPGTAVFREDDQVSVKSGSFFSRDKNKEGGSGLSLTRHSLTNQGSRKGRGL